MKKQKHEISQSRMLNKIYKDNLYRFFRVYHPIYDIAVNVDIERDAEEYHIIEKYMDKLVCGYVGESGEVTGKCYVESRKQLYELLGLEHQAYEVAERFFEDLVLAGHFRETKDGIIALQTAHESVKLQVKKVSSTEYLKKSFDAFSMQLVPEEFYEMMNFAVDVDKIHSGDERVKYATWLNPDYIKMEDAVEIEQAIRRCRYDGNELLKKGLPQGSQGMRIPANPDVKLKFFPYYLAVFKDGERFYYRAYRVDNAEPIEWLGEMYMTTNYSSTVQTINGLSERQETGNVNNPIWSAFQLTKGGEPCKEEGVTRRKKDGNYEWTLQDWQLERLLIPKEGDNFNSQACKIIAESDISALTSFEAGRIVYIHKTEKQKKALLDAVRNPDCDRKKLFADYKNGNLS